MRIGYKRIYSELQLPFPQKTFLERLHLEEKEFFINVTLRKALLLHVYFDFSDLKFISHCIKFPACFKKHLFEW